MLTYGLPFQCKSDPVLTCLFMCIVLDLTECIHNDGQQEVEQYEEHQQLE